MPLKLTNVSVSKNNFEILKDLNLEISENTVVLGNSGSGKSTFLDLLAGKVFPSKGKLTKENIGKVILVNRDYGFHRLVGSVYQYYQQRFNSQDAEMGPTVYEVLQNQVIPVGTVDSKSVTLNQALYQDDWVENVCKTLKIEHLLSQKITSLSNGETRRTLIAYAILQKPHFLLLDNPFTGLDINSRAQLKEILSTLENLVLVANLNDVSNNFEKIISLYNGNITFSGLRTDFKPKEEPIVTNTQLLNKIKELHETEKQDFEKAIEIKNGKVSYSGKNVLEGINWKVKKGEKWALMGPNGSGKSSLLSLIIGDNPQCYQNELYLFDKRRGTGESIWDLKKKMGFVSPELQLYFNKNQLVWKTVASGFYDSAGLFAKINETQLQTVHSYLELMQIEHLADRKLSELSFGQQRLVFLARALVKNPPLLILDEPCQGLDYNQMVFFREMLNDIVVHQNKTLVFVTHYEDEIPACVDQRLNLFEGKEIK